MVEPAGARSAVSLRRALVARRGPRRWLGWAGLVAMALGLLFALEGAWAAAVPVLVIGTAVMWLVGAWVMPWSRDAYVRRVARLWRAWATDTQASYSQFAQKQAKFIERLRALSPPPECLSAHEQLISLVQEHERLRTQRTTSPAHASELASLQRAARQVKEELIADASADAQRPYVVALERLFTVRREQYAEAAALSERATEEAVRKLERIKPPASVAAEHALVVAGFREHLAVRRQFHAASQAADARGVAAAMAGWETSGASLRDLVQRATDGLRYYERWPAPVEPTPASDGGHR